MVFNNLLFQRNKTGYTLGAHDSIAHDSDANRSIAHDSGAHDSIANERGQTYTHH